MKRIHWSLGIAGLSLFSIILYVILYFSANAYANIPLFIVIIIGGIPLFLEIVWKLFSGNLGADSLAALAIVTATVLSQYLAADLIILMLASGEALESFAQRKASSVLRALAKRMPTVAHKKTNEKIVDITLDKILLGDEILVFPHEVCPVDGMVIEGQGSMDESYLTGEPYQIQKTPGTFVLSGAVNGNALLKIRTERLTSDSRYSAIMKVLQEAEEKKPNMRRLGDQIGAIFGPVAFILALLAWYFSGDAIRFLAVLVIATPCPLLIAIPITIISAISMAAQRSIIIKDPSVLERLPTCTTAIFDKTGTLTYGRPQLTEVFISPQFKAETILQYVASVERYSKHPLSSAILAKAKEQKINLLSAVQASEKPGQGLLGIMEGHTIQVTSRKKIHENYPEMISLLPPLSSGLECVILWDNQYAATYRFHDAPREESRSFIHHLGPHHHFKKIMLLSGDRESEVQYFAKLLNITDVRASQTPEQKIEIVREETKKSPTLFMGDGINDAPALTAATVGVAFGEYSEITSEAAGVVVMENTLYKVDELIHLSLKTRKIALQSALGGMLLSAIGMAFAAAGFIPPVLGAILQECIDVFAILNALRLIIGEKIKIDIPE